MSPRAWLVIVTGLLIAMAAPEGAEAQGSAASKPSPPKPPGPGTAASREVDRLVEQLRRDPARPKPVRDQAAADRFAIYLMDVADGKATLIADQPEPGLVRCGSPAWSHDGRRIAFDATPGRDFGVSRLKVIQLENGRPTVSDFGPGNCPSFAPADERIAFLSNVANPSRGVCLMQADGSGRRFLGDYGIPKWSPDGRQMMIISFGDVRQVTIMDADPNRSGKLMTSDDLRIRSVPSWAGPGLIAAVVGEGDGDRIALIDVGDPARASIKEVLWRRPEGSDITPTYPIYSPSSRLCVFAGRHANGMSLYSFRPGPPAAAARVLGEPKGHELIVNLDFSPDGRYVLYADHAPVQ